MQRDSRAYLADILEARQMIDFRNQPTHEYPNISDFIV